MPFRNTIHPYERAQSLLKSKQLVSTIFTTTMPFYSINMLGFRFHEGLDSSRILAILGHKPLPNGVCTDSYNPYELTKEMEVLVLRRDLEERIHFE